MKFFCEYCGCRIDSEKDTKCPNCGASYKKNATFIKLEKEKNEEKEQARDEYNKVRKVSKIVFVFPLIIFIIIFVSVIIQIIQTRSRSNEIQSRIDETETTTSEVETEKPVTVGINEYGKTSKYQAKVVSYEKITSEYETPKEGYEFIRFNFNVENLANKQILSENINCIVDGIAQNSVSIAFNRDESIPTFIAANLTVKGEKTFEVPINAEYYDVKYGDYITIHIEK